LCTPKSQAFLKELLQGTDVQLKELNVESPQPIDKQSNSDFVKIHLNRGKSSKIRPGDVLGALTQQCGLTRTEVGGIFIFDHFSHVEVVATKSISTLSRLSGQRMKNLPVRATLAETLSPARSRTF
jgi:ATP-independent RNA helicase DbpA